MRTPKFNPRQIGKFVVLSVVGLVIIYVIIMLLIAKPSTPTAINDAQAVAVKNNVNNYDKAVIEAAKQAFNEAKAAGLDLTTGPCLLESAETGWVFDVAHLPREPIDDLPENQCPAYLSGKIQHFVELDSRGAVIRLK